MSKKKKNGRFNGLSEEEVKKKESLPDYLEANLDIVIVGINPSLMAAYKGRYYAGPGNHFYKLLHASELVPRFVSFEEDSKLLQYKIGLTNIVDRATRSSADLTKIELKQGCRVVAEKLKLFKPKIALFNGKCIYQVFAESLGVKKFDFGIQYEKIGDTAIWVVPSSSARCSNFPRLNDKLHFYQAVRRHLQFLKGEIKDADINEFYFGGKYTQAVSVPKRIKNGSSPLNNRTGEYCPQFVVMEIHDGSNKNEFKQSLSESKSSDDNGSTDIAIHYNQISPNNNIYNLSQDCDDNEEDTDYLIDLLKRKFEDNDEVEVVKQKEMKRSNISDIRKNLERFMYKKN